MTTSRLDLDDYHANVNAGYHCANMAGTWMSMVFGFGGMRLHDGILEFAPVIPEKWNGYTFKIRYQGRLISIHMDKNGAQYKVLEGEPVKITSYGKEITIE